VKLGLGSNTRIQANPDHPATGILRRKKPSRREPAILVRERLGFLPSRRRESPNQDAAPA